MSNKTHSGHSACIQVAKMTWGFRTTALFNPQTLPLDNDDGTPDISTRDVLNFLPVIRLPAAAQTRVFPPGWRVSRTITQTTT
jgi:hypothetical protein